VGEKDLPVATDITGLYKAPPVSLRRNHHHYESCFELEHAISAAPPLFRFPSELRSIFPKSTAADHQNSSKIKPCMLYLVPPYSSMFAFVCTFVFSGSLIY